MRARGVAGLTRLPVTEEIAGSNPVGPAIVLMFKMTLKMGHFCLLNAKAPEGAR